jgi:ubiquinone/menaquinone biosynthesis C-methylase UbiE
MAGMAGQDDAQKGLQRLYWHTANRYEAEIMPAFGPLAADLAGWVGALAASHARGELEFDDPFGPDFAQPGPQQPTRPAMTLLDIGTGTGALARALSQQPMLGGCRIFGLDVSRAMLAEAVNTTPAAITYAQGDIQGPPFRRRAFGLAVSSFGLNSTRPRDALRTIGRLLRPGGLLAFQEWGGLDALSRIVDQAVDDFTNDATPEDPTDADAAMWAFVDAPRPWYDQLQEVEDYYEMLKKTGFRLAWVREAAFVTVRFGSMAAFVGSKLAWASRRLLLDALPAAQRAAFDASIHARLREFVNSDGTLDWSPPLFRVCAVWG